LEDLFRKPVPRAIFRGDEISLEWGPTEGQTAHSVLTRSRGGHYSGHSVWAAGTPREQRAVVEAVLYSNADGHVLVGQEKWANGDADWFVVQLFNGQTI
jgi:hypothetical protein